MGLVCEWKRLPPLVLHVQILGAHGLSLSLFMWNPGDDCMAYMSGTEFTGGAHIYIYVYWRMQNFPQKVSFIWQHTCEDAHYPLRIYYE